MNAHHTTWGSRNCSQRGKDLVAVIHQLDLQVLNTGSFTFVRRAGRVSCTAIDVSLATRGASYDWATEPDSWGSDHLPIPSPRRVERLLGPDCAPLSTGEPSGSSSAWPRRSGTSWDWLHRQRKRQQSGPGSQCAAQFLTSTSYS
ncbi:hypothetical protein MTO96_029892 [Rhipicephalus appendiculatus]